MAKKTPEELKKEKKLKEDDKSKEELDRKDEFEKGDDNKKKKENPKKQENEAKKIDIDRNFHNAIRAVRRSKNIIATKTSFEESQIEVKKILSSYGINESNFGDIIRKIKKIRFGEIKTETYENFTKLLTISTCIGINEMKSFFKSLKKVGFTFEEIIDLLKYPPKQREAALKNILDKKGITKEAFEHAMKSNTTCPIRAMTKDYKGYSVSVISMLDKNNSPSLLKIIMNRDYSKLPEEEAKTKIREDILALSEQQGISVESLQSACNEFEIEKNHLTLSGRSTYLDSIVDLYYARLNNFNVAEYMQKFDKKRAEEYAARLREFSESGVKNDERKINVSDLSKKFDSIGLKNKKVLPEENNIQNQKI